MKFCDWAHQPPVFLLQEMPSGLHWGLKLANDFRICFMMKVHNGTLRCLISWSFLGLKGLQGKDVN